MARDSLTEDIGRAIMRVRRAILAEARERLEQQGEDLLAWQALNQLDRGGPMAQSELAFRTGQHPTGMSRLLSDLEARKCVRRERDTADRRRLVISISRAGRARLESGRPAVQGAVEKVLDPLDAADRRTLRDLLGRMLGGTP